MLIEAAHSYRFPARIARRKLAAVDAVPEDVRAIAWKAQTRLCQRYRHMMAKGKPTQVIVTAIARELAGFVWSIACITSDPPAKTSVASTTSNDAVCRAPPPQLLKTSARRAAPSDQTGTPIELRYSNGEQAVPKANNPKAGTPASRTRRSAAASAEGSAG